MKEQSNSKLQDRRWEMDDGNVINEAHKTGEGHALKAESTESLPT
jgi:hypothetical protein